MIPILYQENETNFNTNGIGMLYDTISYKVIEDRNASFELELEYPAGGRWASELVDLRLISAKPNDEDESHLFRIYEIVKNLEEQTITVYAASKSNDLGGNLVQKVSLTNVTPQQALTAMKADLVDPTSYNFVSNIQTLKSVHWEHITPLTAILGTDNSLIKLWGGEVKRTNDTIFVYSRRGTDKVTTIRPGKGLDGFKMTTSTKGMITSILPFVKYTPKDSETEVIVRGTRVNSPLMNNYPVLCLAPIDYSYDRTLLPEGEMTQEQFNAALLANINAKASTYFTTQNPGCDKPKVTIDVTISQLSDSSEYEQFKKLEHIALTDSVVVWVEKYNVDVEVTINSVVYNGMSEMVESFKAGNAKTGLMDDVRKHYDNDIDKIKEYVSTVENGIYNTIRVTAEGKNNIFSGYTEPDESLVKEDDIWYKPVADGEIEMYRWSNGGWALAVGNASKLAIGSIDANIINLVNLNANNISTGTITGANGGWDLNTGEFWLGSVGATGSGLYWNGSQLIIKISSGENLEDAIGDTVKSLDVEYYLSTSSASPVGGTWQTTAPAWTNDKFIFSRSKITYKDNSIEYKPNANGTNISGATGTAGKGITSIVEYYYSSTSSTETIGGSWDTTPQTWVNGRYSWTKSKITYTDGSSIETDPICVSGASGYTPIKGVDYFDGVDGNNGSDGASSYLWVRYSQNANGNPMTTEAAGAKYIGTAVTTTPSVPAYTSFNWSLIKGTDGLPGEDGVDGKTSYLHIKYSNDGGATFTSNNGETVGDWIGTYVDFVQADSASVSQYTWNKVKGEPGYTPVKGTDYFDGVDGNNGADGASSYLWVMYSQNSNGNPMVDSPTGAKYIGIATTTTNSKPGTYSSYKWSLIKGTDGIKGEDGVDGQTSYLHIKYSNDGGATFTANNGETVGEWIGTYVDFNATDSSSVGSYTWNKVKGEPGANGISITSVDVWYYSSTSATSLVDGSWNTTAPTWVNGRYIWSKTITTYSSGSPDESTPACITGAIGTTGATGKGITSITEEFYLSTSKTTQTGSSWKTTPDPWSPGKYMWTRSKIVYNNPTSTEYTTPLVSSEWEAVNDLIPRFETNEADIAAANGNILLRALKTEVEAPILKQSTAPTHVNGRLWLDTSVTPNVLKRSTGSAWVKVTPTTAAEVGAYSSGDGSALAGRVSTAESHIGVNGSNITSKVSQTTYNAKMGTFTGTVSEIKQTADNVKLSFDNQVIGGTNLILVKTLTLGKYLNSSGGVVTSSTWAYTDFIPVTPSTDYIVGGHTNLGSSPSTCFYNSSQQFISAVAGGARQKVKTPSNAAFMRFSFVYSDIGKIKLEKGTVNTDWSPAPEELYVGVTKIDKDGVNVSVSNSDINTSIAYDGLTIRDGPDDVVAIFGNAGAVMPKADIAVLLNPDVIQRRSSIDVNVGVGQPYSTVTQALDDLFGDTRRYIAGTVSIYIRTDISDDILLEGFVGGFLNIIIADGARLTGRIIGRHCSARLKIYGVSGTTYGTIKHAGPLRFENCPAVYCYYLNIDGNGGSYGVVSADGSNVHCAAMDFVRTTYAMTADNESVIKSRDNKGNVAVAVRAQYSGMAFAVGTVPVSSSTVMQKYYGYNFQEGTLSQVASAYSPPAVTNKQFVQVFTSATFDTLVYGSSNVDSYYGATAAQNRWDSSMGWKQGRIRMSRAVYDFYNGGSAITVKVRLRRRNSTHGNSGAVVPAGIGTFSTGALRGGWTSWATVSSSLFGSGGADLRLYNGVSGSSGYAIWDAIEVQVTVTKSV